MANIWYILTKKKEKTNKQKQANNVHLSKSNVSKPDLSLAS